MELSRETISGLYYVKVNFNEEAFMQSWRPAFENDVTFWATFFK